jgi:5-methylcytosine-specific restriction enzyme subunit McrC
MKRTIVLSEYQPQRLASDHVSDAAAHHLWQHYPRLVTVDFPSPKTDGQWQLTAQGWVGMVPVLREFTLVLQPKVALANVLGMVEVAYRLESFQILRGLVAATTVPELYERLALRLAEQTLSRGRRGLHRPYQRREALSPFVRGRLQVADLVRRPTAVAVPCLFHEQAVDVLDNQILHWTLHRILQSDLCGTQSRGVVRQAVRLLQPLVTLQPVTVAACRNQLYTRLNADYAPLHALAAFFLEANGPSHQPGDVASVPFVVNMARLYEQFVAAWLQQHLPAAWQLQCQERHPLTDALHFAIDLVLYARRSGAPVAVLDTKYKMPDRGPDTADVAQVVAYAAAKGVAEAILIYPQSLVEPLDTVVGGVHVRTLTFALDGEFDGALDAAGQQFLNQLNLPVDASPRPHPPAPAAKATTNHAAPVNTKE